MEKALEAWKLDKARKEKEKGQEDAKKKKIEAYRSYKNEDLKKIWKRGFKKDIKKKIFKKIENRA